MNIDFASPFEEHFPELIKIGLAINFIWSGALFTINYE